MTKFEISDAMLDAAEQAYDTIAARVIELEAENKRLREGLFWIADIGFVQEKHAKQHADDCCKLARKTLGYQEQTALKGGEI
jgi:cell division protein FtsB